MKNAYKISKREREVLELIAFEHTMPEIAIQIFISVNTAVSHKRNLLMKLNAKNIAGLVRRGFEQGYLTMQQSN